MKKQLLLLMLLWAACLSAQNERAFQRRLNWAAAPAQWTLTNGLQVEVWKFDDCTYGDVARSLPLYTERFPLDGPAQLSATVTDVTWEPFAKKTSADDAFLNDQLQVETLIEQERDRFYGRIKVLPIRKNGAGFERATAFNLQVRINPIPPGGANPVQARGFTETSALSSGVIYKFGVTQSGIYKLDYNFLKNELGLSDLDNIDPRSIRIYGNGGAMLPEKNSDPRPDDLLENAIEVVGESDGKFNTGDYILFYAVGPRPWQYRVSNNDPQLTTRVNLYDTHAWYFLKVNDGSGARVGEQASVSATYITEQFDDFARLEEEKTNLLHFNSSSQGSGKRWFGDYFYQSRNKSYTFEFPNAVTDSLGRIRGEFAGRSDVGQSVRFEVAGASLLRSIGAVDTDNGDGPFASNAVLTGTFKPTSDQVQVNVIYPEVSAQSEGWLDYLELNVRRRLVMTGNSMSFRDIKTLNQAAAEFRLSNAGAALRIWDITTPQAPKRQAFTLNGSIATFGATTQGVLRNFIAFNETANFPKPEATAGKITNQNLHGLRDLHMAIIYHPEFEAQALRLAEHRRSFSGLNVAAVNVLQLFNEFSSGGKDPTAIRDFARMLLERDPVKFEYLLLFGDGSFDPKNNTNSADNKDFIPVFETAESFSPINAFPSDDFYGLLSPEEGSALTGALDISVGRLVPHAPDEAEALVNKIIAYDQDPALLGDWHLRVLFIADDEDGNAHINQADKLAIDNANAEAWFNNEKVYFDAYQQVATSAGQRYPDAKAAINSNIFRGNLITHYIGHGGPRGWSQERVIDNNDIANWDNPNRYPLIITATCTFGGYDDYTTLTGGEQALLRVNSGAVALFTTVRSVYINGNEDLTDAVQSILFKRLNGQYRSIGRILKDAKNKLTSDIQNARRFTLLGDPAMLLAMPEYRVATTKISGPNGPIDTLRALMPVTLEGMVTDTSGVLMGSFNGKVYVTLFDKAQTLTTLEQDQYSFKKEFQVQRNVIFKGLATVSNGKFTINFVVPKDINYPFGYGKISYYAENGTPLDAAGADNQVVIGGNAGLIQDDQPPQVQVFLNTDAFAFGGITDNSPKILVKCADDYGMNVSGTSLGHDLTAVLDGNVLETIVLNEFYQSAQDDARRGQAVYPLNNLTPGRHTLAVKGWDVANNSGEGYTEFVVAADGKAALDHVLNYPNPFTTNTYFQFEHNLAGQVLDVQISIFTVAGKLVKTIQQTLANNDGYRVTDIQWDGKDEYGDVLARGVYLYRVKVRGTDTSGNASTAESAFEKLVILK